MKSQVWVWQLGETTSRNEKHTIFLIWPHHPHLHTICGPRLYFSFFLQKGIKSNQVALQVKVINIC